MHFYWLLTWAESFQALYLDTKQIIVSRDAIFYEDFFPFQNNTNKRTEIDTIPLPSMDDTLSNCENDVPGNIMDHEEIIDVDFADEPV